MPRKGRRGGDSGSDDEGGAGAGAGAGTPKAPAGTDAADAARGKQKRGGAKGRRGGGADGSGDEKDVVATPGTSADAGGKGKKSGKKGKRRDDDSDSDAGAAAAPAAADGGKSSTPQTSADAGGKGKKSGKKGKRRDDDSDSDGGAAPAPAAAADGGKSSSKKSKKKRRGDDDSGSDGAAAAAPAPASADASKSGKSKKSGGKKKRRGDDDSGSDGGAAAPAAAAAARSDEEEAVPMPATKQKRKDKKGKRGAVGSDDDAGEAVPDVERAAEAAAVVDPDDDDDVEAAPAAAVAQPVKRAKRKDKKNKRPIVMSDDEDAEGGAGEAAPDAAEGAGAEAAAAAAGAAEPEAAAEGDDAPAVAQPVKRAKRKDKDKKNKRPIVMSDEEAEGAGEEAESGAVEAVAVATAAMSLGGPPVVAAAPAPVPAAAPAVAPVETAAAAAVAAPPPVAVALPALPAAVAASPVSVGVAASGGGGGGGGVGGGGGGGGGGDMDEGGGAGESKTADTRTALEIILDKAARGEKLSNRERRDLKAYEDTRARDVEDARRIESGLANFALSQTGKEDLRLQYSLDIHVDRFSITAYKKELFVDAELHIVAGRRYGLLGPNGMGKSTLMKYLAARELAMPPKVDVLLVEQEVVADETPAVQVVLAADVKRASLLAEERALSELSARGETTPEQDDRLGEVYEELAHIGADSAEAHARKILAGLGFTAEMMDQPTKHFSGGWRMRISLARALFVKPTLLLLDEPTNHLDLNAVLWLDEYLQKWKNTLIVVSHDQDFLSSVVTDIIHLEDKKLFYYKGDYNDFKAMHEQRRLKKVKDWEKHERQMRALKDAGHSSKQADVKVKKREAGAAKKGGKKKDEMTDAGASASTEIERPRDYLVKFEFDSSPPLPAPVIEVLDAGFRYGPTYPVLFKEMRFGIDTDTRAAIVGPNGVGKSTLVNLLMGDLEPTMGEIRRKRSLRIGKYNQHFVDILPMDRSPVDFIREKFGDVNYQAARNLLGRFGLGGHAHTILIRDLSGGQKARVVFAMLALQKPHIIFLDEPTNHLDVESIDALSEGIRAFRGGVLLVSHDARLITSTDCQLWVCAGQDCYAYDGEFDDYRTDVLDALHRAAEEEDRRAAERASQRAAKKEAAAAQRAAKIRQREAREVVEAAARAEAH